MARTWYCNVASVRIIRAKISSIIGHVVRNRDSKMWRLTRKHWAPRTSKFHHHHHHYRKYEWKLRQLSIIANCNVIILMTIEALILIFDFALAQIHLHPRWFIHRDFSLGCFLEFACARAKINFLIASQNFTKISLSLFKSQSRFSSREGNLRFAHNKCIV